MEIIIMATSETTLSNTFNDDELSHIMRQHNPHGQNNYTTRIQRPSDELLATIPLDRLTKEETLAALWFLGSNGTAFHILHQLNEQTGELTFSLFINERDNAHNPGLITQINSHKEACTNRILLDQFLNGTITDIELLQTEKGIYLQIKDVTSDDATVVEAHLRKHDIPYSYKRNSSFGPVFVISYNDAEKIYGLQDKIREQSQPTTAVPIMSSPEVHDKDLPKIRIIDTANKGLYVPVDTLNPLQKTELETLLTKAGIQFKDHASRAADDNGQPIGKVLQIPIGYWPALSQVQIKIASKIDNRKDKEYFLDHASADCQAQLDNLSYKPLPLEPK